MQSNSLFLTLRVFSATGGIEKVCRLMAKGLGNLTTGTTEVYSMYDTQQDVDSKYIAPENFHGFGKRKISFVLAAFKRGCSSDVVFLSHINLLSIGFLIKLFSPTTKLVLFAHGIEVWSPLSILRKYMLSKCDRVLAVSSFTKQTIQAVNHYPQEKITVFNNCLDPYLTKHTSAGKDPALLKKLGLNNTDLILLTLTRLSSKELYKGYDHVLFSVKALKEKYPEIKYLIVGKFDDKEKQRLDKIISSLSIGNNVVFTGFIPDETLAAHFSLADLYVMPSKKEGFGIVFIEAMFYGLPVIAGNMDGSVDALLNGRLGLLVSPDDQQEINNAIEKVITSRELYLPDNKLLMEHFSFEKYQDKIKNILSSL
jgi:phosphatidyl-myo-inositol dimannoside synthase